MEIRSFARIRLWRRDSHTRSLPFCRVGRRPGRRLTFHRALSPLSPPGDRRLRSLQLIAVRPNGSPIRVNTVAIMSRPRSLRPKREVRRNGLSSPNPLCVYMSSFFLRACFSQTESFGTHHPSSLSSISILIRRYLLPVSFFFFFIAFLEYILNISISPS